VRGDVVVIPFPFSDLSQAKRRPALVLAELNGDDLILCQITSQATKDRYSISLEADDFSEGRLNQSSSLRPNRLFTADSAIILYKAGSVRPRKLDQVVERVIEILRS
jgi:mRNA interferase MazF